ncbi:hypothetical protein COO16_04035 [Bacillus pseudomycoides]|nr:DUF559 domain-containing protein [Bacillus pseudomycoides]PDY14141.1 hypothetical protein COO16_04035 [Bacillus pseudomycoides]
MMALLVVLICSICFYVLANITTKKSVYDPTSCIKRKKCANKLERKVYDYLRNLEVSPCVQERISKYKLDFSFYHPNGGKLCLEVDGYIFHNTPEAKKRDAIRDSFLRKKGWEILRLNERELQKDFYATMRKVETKLYDMDLLPLEHPSVQLKIKENLNTEH